MISSLFAGAAGIVSAVVAAIAAVLMIVLFGALIVVTLPYSLVALASATLYLRNRLRDSRLRKQEADELAEIIAADKARQAIKDEIVWGPIRRGETESAPQPWIPSALD